MFNFKRIFVFYRENNKFILVPVKSSDDIFKLIKSLSKQEKSYFKKFASAFSDEEGSNYLKLFDELVNKRLKKMNMMKIK